MSRTKERRPNDVLDEFRRRIGDLVHHPLITKNQLRAAHPILAIVSSMMKRSGQPINPSVEAHLERSDQLVVEHFVVRMRHLRQSKETGSVDKVVKAIKKLGPPQLFLIVQAIGNAFSSTPIENKMTATIDGKKLKINERRFHALVEKSDLFHSDESEAFLRLKDSGLEHFAHTLLMRDLSRQMDAATDLYVVLRDHNVLKALDNEPEWLRDRHYQLESPGTRPTPEPREIHFAEWRSPTT